MLQRVRTWHRSRAATVTTTPHMSEKVLYQSADSTPQSPRPGHRDSQSLIESLRGTSPLDTRMPKALVASPARLIHRDTTPARATSRDEKERPSIESLNSYHTASADVSKWVK